MTKDNRDDKAAQTAEKLKILYAVFEADPFIKTGGLGDVGGSLPAAVRREGADIRVILPKLLSIPEKYRARMKKVAECTVPLGWRNQYCGVETLREKGVTYYFIDNEYYFKRENPYGYDDDGERIAYFSKAVTECLQHIPGFFPDVIHCNDWHTALIPVFLREHYMEIESYRRIKTVFSVHNIKFQGIFGGDMLGNVLGLSDVKAAADQLSYGDAVNFMKGALNYSDRLTTVSPTYAEEICTPWYGENMQDIFLRRKNVLTGILNGIDTYKYSPGRDNSITEKYNFSSVKKGKAANKAALQKELGLKEDPDVPLIVLISRLTEQKGLDLVKFILDELLHEDVQMAVLGVGDKEYEDAFRYFQSIVPEKMSACIKFDQGLSSRFYAGADILLMPSKFEPCGLSQMIAMRYGTIPVVRETGGLKDTVTDCRDGSEDGCGFSFPDYNAHQLLFAVKDAAAIYRDDKKAWQQLVKRAMKKDFSWKKSAKSYMELYEQLAEEN